MSEIENDKRQPSQWLVDLENVGSRWHRIMDTAEPGDTVHLFYSDKTVAIKINELGPASARGIGFRFHACANGLPNAMDFQMMCALGMIATESPSDRFVIYTGDNGFRSVLGYLADRDVKCVCVNPGLAVQPETDISESAMQYDSIRSVYRDMCRSAGMSSEDARIMSAILVEAMKRPANKRKLDCRNRMIQRWGNSDGGTMYTSLKAMIHRIADEGPWPETADPPFDPSRISSAIQNLTGMHTSAALGEKIFAMMENALQTSNPEQSLRDQLMGHYKNSGNAARVFAILQPHLAGMKEQHKKEM